MLARDALLLSMPGVGPRTAVQILMAVGNMSNFPSPGHLASYAGLSPRTQQSKTSVMSNSVNLAGNKEIEQRPMAISFCIYQTPRAFQTILRTRTPTRQETQCGRHRSGPPQSQRPFRHDAQRCFLPRPRHHSGGHRSLESTRTNPYKPSRPRTHIPAGYLPCPHTLRESCQQSRRKESNSP